MYILFLVNDKSELAPDLYALFPELRKDGLVDGYASDTGFCSFSVDYVNQSRLAKEKEYLPILGVLEQKYNYKDLVIVKRFEY